MPITRITDITPLDVLGLPVWLAITPLAKDLTTHAGKGRSHAAARLSAIMEAIERTSAESVSDDRLLDGSYADLAARRPGGFEPVDPMRFNLPFDTRFRVDLSIQWLLAYDLIRRSPFWVPVDLVLNPPRQGLLRRVETNGLASGNTLTEAALHALYEVVERYSEMRMDFFDRHGEPTDRALRPSCFIDPHTLPSESLEWVLRIEAVGMRLTMRDETCELGIPVFRMKMYDPQFPLRDAADMSLDGFGADLDPGRAALRAITEAVQSHTGTVHGGRDTVEGYAGYAGRLHSWRRAVECKRPPETVPFRPAARASLDLAEDLKAVVERLQACGFDHCLVADLTRPDIEVPVVRVLVPDMITIESSRRPPLRCLALLVD